MRAVLVAASNSGFRDPSENRLRTEALLDVLGNASKSVKLIVVPAGYWTAANEGALGPLLAEIVDALRKIVKSSGATLLGGIDSLPVPRSKHLTEVVKKHGLPFWGFAITAGGKLMGPWRQVSTTGDNSTKAPPERVAEVASRALDLAGWKVLPVICGEMHSDGVREQAANAKADLVTVFGHASLGQGLVPSLKAMRRSSGAAVVHVQHLVVRTSASLHWLGSDGRRREQRVWAKLGTYEDREFWAYPCEVHI
jgi:hypothetical protein